MYEGLHGGVWLRYLVPLVFAARGPGEMKRSHFAYCAARTVTMLAELNPRDAVVATEDAFSEGPCRPAVTGLHSWISDRVRWWTVQPSRADLDVLYRPNAEKFVRTLETLDGGEAVVWSAASLQEQLHLAWLLHYVACSSTAVNVVVRTPELAGREHPRFGITRIANRSELRMAKSHRLAGPDVEAGARLWEALCEPAPWRFVSLVEQYRTHQHFACLGALLARFPSPGTGLSYWEQVLLSYIGAREEAHGKRAVADALGKHCGILTPDFVPVAILLKQLIRLDAEGILCIDGRTADPLDSRYRASKRGRAILAGQERRSGFEEWVGGTHVHNGGPQYWFDGERLRDHV